MTLDPQQRLAVETDSPKALVLAGAGSGKTRVLTERIAHLIEERKVSPFEICAFTFTRKAAGEMVSRLEDRIGSATYNLTIGTMHSVALNWIRRFGEMLGLKADAVTVYCDWEAGYLLRDVAQDVGVLRSGKWTGIKKGEIDAMFNFYYSTGSEPEEDDTGRTLFKAFISRCRENNALTYGALLTGMMALIPMVRPHLRIRHILVDEVQDIDALQWSIINTMVEAFGASLFCVGDIDQSIYSFRGAVPGYLVERQREFDIYKMETNYRSRPEIVTAANRLIRHNSQRLDKEMKANRNGGGKLNTLRNIDSEFIAEALAGNMEEMGDTGMEAILCRIHAPLKKLSRLLEERGIKHNYVGKQSALVNSEAFRRFHAFLKLIVNPYDNFSFLLIKDLIGVTGEEYRAIRFRSIQEHKSHFQVWIDSASGEISAAFYRWMHGWPFESMVYDIKYMATGAAPFDGKGWDFDIEPVFQFVFKWLSQNQHAENPAQQYLAWLATYDISEEVATDESEELQLMTIHAAKGLEWPRVVIIGMNEGILPGKQSIANGEIEEERRLAYVAITRAEDQLTMAIRPETKEGRDGKVRTTSPVSRFVEEASDNKQFSARG